MRTKRKHTRQKKTMQRKHKTRRTFRKTKNYKKRKNMKKIQRTRRKRGGMDDDPDSSMMVRPRQSMISVENIIIDVARSFPTGNNILMSRQFPCNRDAKYESEGISPQ